MGMMKTRAAALFVLVIFFAAACSEDAPKTAPGDGARPAIGVLLYKKDDVYISLVAEALEKSLAGWASVLTGNADNDQLTQNEQVAALLEKNVSALIVNMVDPKAATAIVDQIKKSGIPVVFFNREPGENAIRQYGRACFVGTNADDAGKMQGDVIKQLWDEHPEYDRNTDGILQYVMFQGNPDNPEALARTEYSVRRAREHGVDMRQVGETHVCNWDAGLAKDAMLLAFASHGENIELVISNNDAMALGAISALASFGYNQEGERGKFIPTVGVDAIPQAVEAIEKGIMSATVKQDSDAMGKAIAALTRNAVEGKDFLDGTPYAWDASGIAIRIPYSVFPEKEF